MNGADLFGLVSVTWVVGSFAHHRVRLAQQHRHGLELEALGRFPPRPWPEALAQALEALQVAVHDEREARAMACVALAEEAMARGGSAPLGALALQLRLAHLSGPITLELVALQSIRAAGRLMQRFPGTPEPYLARAHAWARLGRSDAALDDLGRALFYGQQEPFFIELVVGSEHVRRHRPALWSEAAELKGAGGSPGPVD